MPPLALSGALFPLALGAVSVKVFLTSTSPALRAGENLHRLAGRRRPRISRPTGPKIQKSLTGPKVLVILRAL